MIDVDFTTKSEKSENHPLGLILSNPKTHWNLSDE